MVLSHCATLIIRAPNESIWEDLLTFSLGVAVEVSKLGVQQYNCETQLEMLYSHVALTGSTHKTGESSVHWKKNKTAWRGNRPLKHVSRHSRLDPVASKQADTWR